MKLIYITSILACTCLFSSLVSADGQKACRKFRKKRRQCKENRCLWRKKTRGCRDPAIACPKISKPKSCKNKGCIWDLDKSSCTQRLYGLGTAQNQLYYYRFDNHTYSDAANFCSQRHNSQGLPSVQTQGQKDAIRKVNIDSTWTSCHRDTSGTLRWGDGSAWNASQNDATLWSGGGPDNLGGHENCVELTSDGYLNDISCDNSYRTVCQYSSPAKHYVAMPQFGTVQHTAASTACSSAGGHLPILRDFGGVTEFQKVINEQGWQSENVWVGSQVSNDDGQQHWLEQVNGIWMISASTESRFDQNDGSIWASGEPNNKDGGESCASTVTFSDMNDQLTINDTSCINWFYVVCEMPGTG